VASNADLPGSAITLSDHSHSPGAAPGPLGPDGHLVVSELVSDRAAAPSPFGDDVTFPLPVKDLTYWQITAP